MISSGGENLSKKRKSYFLWSLDIPFFSFVIMLIFIPLDCLCDIFQTFVYGRPAIFPKSVIFATGFMSFFSVVIALFKVKANLTASTRWSPHTTSQKMAINYESKKSLKSLNRIKVFLQRNISWLEILYLL